MAKAGQAAVSAQILLDMGDPDGACNRAYYAMFDAARAALLASGHVIGKTHKGVLNTFSEYLVKNGPFSKETGRLLKLAETRRYVADYGGDPVELDDAKEMVEQAVSFVTAIRTEFMLEESGDSNHRMKP
ncbi:MAG: HEPN domain-containing protein [Proteobacteria bacterium]|nr:HEPN domain-containing protein [Pseudomonadota bacterium]